MIYLAEEPRLMWPTVAVRTSYLVGEQADCLLRGTATDWLGPASEDFAEFVAVRRGVRTRWGVPSTVFWYVSGEYYLGTLVVRHRLTPELTEVGGHVGYHVVAPWRRQGHATRMLAAGLAECRRLGISKALLTCDHDNEASRKVILSNGGEPDGQIQGEDRFWISVGALAVTAGENVGLGRPVLGRALGVAPGVDRADQQQHRSQQLDPPVQLMAGRGAYAEHDAVELHAPGAAPRQANLGQHGLGPRIGGLRTSVLRTGGVRTGGVRTGGVRVGLPRPGTE